MLFLRKTLAACLLFAAPAVFSQEGSLLGVWELIGRKCAAGSLMPIGDSTQKMIFRSGGRFQGAYRSLPGSDEMTHEEWAEEQRERELQAFEGMKAKHEKLCEEHKGSDMPRVVEETADGEVIDLCDSGHKRNLYARWRESALRQAEDWIAAHPAPEDHGPCEMRSRGSWSIAGGAVAIEEQSLSATRGCGLEGDDARRRMRAVSYYFEEGRLHLVFSPIKDSRKFCGSSDWEAVFIESAE